MIDLNSIKPNPKNQRKWTPEQLEKLANSIREFPEMMSLRPMVVQDGVVIGGNMRLAAIKLLGYEEVQDEWVKQAEDLTPEQVREFVLKDNTHFGYWDFGLLKEISQAKDLLNHLFEEELPNKNDTSVLDVEMIKEYKVLFTQEEKAFLDQFFNSMEPPDFETKTTNRNAVNLLEIARKWAEQKAY